VTSRETQGDRECHDADFIKKMPGGVDTGFGEDEDDSSDDSMGSWSGNRASIGTTATSIVTSGGLGKVDEMFLPVSREYPVNRGSFLYFHFPSALPSLHLLICQGRDI
jgi:hypothetical protein